MEAATQAFLSNSGLIALGFALRKLGMLQEVDGRSALRLSLNVTLPAAVFRSITSPVASGAASGLPWLALSAWSTGFFLSAAGGWLAYRRREASLDRAFLTGMTSGVNLGMFAYPIIEGVFGADGLRVAAFVDVPNLMMNFCYNRAVFEALARSPTSALRKRELLSGALWRMATAPPMVAIWAALSCNHWQAALPGQLSSIVADLAGANKVIVMLGLGALLQLQFPREQRAVLLQLVTLRYALALVAATASVAASLALGGGGQPLVLAVGVAVLLCPIPGVSVQHAAEVGCSTALAAAAANASNVVSFGLLFAVAMLWQTPRLLLGFLASSCFVCSVLATAAFFWHAPVPEVPGKDPPVAPGGQPRRAPRAAQATRGTAGAALGVLCGAYGRLADGRSSKCSTPMPGGRLGSLARQHLPVAPGWFCRAPPPLPGNVGAAVAAGQATPRLPPAGPSWDGSRVRLSR